MAGLDASYIACLNEAHLICTICDGPLRKPIISPCFHAFCSTCLNDRFAQQKGKVKQCPVCDTELSPDERKSPPQVQFLQTLQEVIKSKRFEQKHCGFCDREKYAVWYCKKCDDNLCGQCKENHSKLKGKEKHREFDFLDETVKEICQRRNDFHCEDHAEEILAYYCNTCSKTVCVVCESARHDAHTTTRLSKKADTLRKELSSAADDFITNLQELQEKSNIRNRKATESRSQIEEDVKKWAKTLKNAIDAKAKEILGKLSNQDESDQSDRSVDYSLWNDVCFFPKQLSDYGSDVEVINLADTVMVKLQNLKAKRGPSYDDNLKVMKFIPELKCSSSDVLSIGWIDERSGSNDNSKISKRENERTEMSTFAVQNSLLTTTKMLTSFQAEWDVTGISVTSHNEYLINSRLQKACLVYQASGNLVREVKSRGLNPFDVTVLKNGNYVITDRDAKKVNVYSPEGNFLETLKIEIGEPAGIAVLSNGDLVITDLQQKDVCVFSPHRKMFPLKSLKTENGNRTFKWPLYVTVNSMDEIIVSDNELHCVKIFDKKGKLRTQHGRYGEDGENLRGPRGVCTDSSDYIFVTDYTNDRIHLLSPEGKFVRILTARENGLSGPRVVTIDAEGRLVVCQENATVKIIDYKK
ncbi:E3 ubiquitin-protein ligase TRIM71-like [Liolophura sinensis]|uniref:E3 ubiquitin-protein ligase TRIM71-like n=1 Tax=Liolophura sinensis TaxID=3198878 RepID=UPI0031588DE8